MGWFDFIKKQPVPGKALVTNIDIEEYQAAEKDFWRTLLGERLLENKVKDFKARQTKANRLALETGDTAARDSALEKLNKEKRNHAKFSNMIRVMDQMKFRQTLEGYKNVTDKETEQNYTAKYNERLQDHEIDMLTPNVEKTAEGYKQEYFRLVKLERCTKDKKCVEQCSCVDNPTELATIEEEQKEKLRTMNRDWWAVWIGLKNAKYFSLSCGTTMGGALIIIAAPFGTGALIAATIIAVPVVYIVTRADWWLTNKALPELTLELASPIEFLKKFWKKLKAQPVSTIYNVVISFVVTVVWAALTYDTTLELTTQLYEKSEISGGIASTVVLGITGVMAAVAAWKLYKSYEKNGKLRGLKTVWALTLAAATVGLGFWALSAEAVAFQQASVLAATIMMTFFTAPAVYTVFNLYTDRFVKAFHGPIDQETGEDNVFHYKNIDKSFNDIVTDARKNNGVAKFKTTYRVIMGIGMFLAVGAAFMLQQTIVGQELSFTTLPDYRSPAFLGSMLGSFGIVGITVASFFAGINSYTGVNLNPEVSKNQGISKDMLYKALVVLGLAALIGTYAIVTASNHMMGNIFTQWLGAPDSAVPMLNGVITMGIGFLGAAGFYFGSSINTVKNLFATSVPDEDLTDPTGIHRQPDFSKSIYNNKTFGGKVAHHVSDTANLFGTNPTKKVAFVTILGNAIANSFQTIMSAASVVAAALFSGSAAVASAGANWGMNPDNLKPSEPPKVIRQEHVTEMVRFLSQNEKIATKNASSPKAQPKQ